MQQYVGILVSRSFEIFLIAPSIFYRYSSWNQTVA